MGGKSSQPSSTSPREFILKNALYVAIAAAVIALAAFAFVTDAPAYAGTAAATCANCHVMDLMYENYYPRRASRLGGLRGLPPVA